MDQLSHADPFSTFSCVSSELEAPAIPKNARDDMKISSRRFAKAPTSTETYRLPCLDAVPSLSANLSHLKDGDFVVNANDNDQCWFRTHHNGEPVWKLAVQGVPHPVDPLRRFVLNYQGNPTWSIEGTFKKYAARRKQRNTKE